MIIIFVTVTEDYVFQSFDVGAFHYLVKPFEDDKFIEVLQNAVWQFEERKTKHRDMKTERPGLIITTKGKHVTVSLEDIVSTLGNA